MTRKKPAELHPLKEGVSAKLAFLKLCLKFVSVLTALLSAINRFWDILNKLLSHFSSS